MPGKKAEKGYVLLREVLAKTGKIGIARVVIRTRQYLAALSPRGDALMVDLMRFPQEIVKPDEFTLPKGNSKSYRVTPQEVAMATQETARKSPARERRSRRTTGRKAAS